MRAVMSTGAWRQTVRAGLVLTTVVAVSAVSAPAAFAASDTLSLLAGNGTFGTPTAPGPATASSFSDAGGVAVDHAGNVYFADS
jgi:hypothetical protein